jgi:hypothetical protein
MVWQLDCGILKMSDRQVKMAVFWAVFLFDWVVIFGVAEGYALIVPDALTLSRFTFGVSEGWTPIVPGLGLIVGMLAEHFWRYLTVGLQFGRPNAPPYVRFPLLALGWILVIIFTGGGPAIFLSGIPIGMATTHWLWPWNPTDATDRRG